MCTSLAAGKGATADGSILISRNEDFGQNNWNKYLKGMRAPQYDGSKTDTWTLGNGLSVPMPENKFYYCGIADASGDSEASAPIGDHYLFEARGFNDQNVMMTATNSMGINDNAAKADPTVQPGIEESIIVTLILPQAQSAEVAVERLGRYVEDYGAAEAAGICIADSRGAWYMEIGSGHHWIAVRIPDDKYLIVSNCMRIRGVDLTDTENVKCSRGLFEFTKENGLLDSPDKHNFDFASAFGYPESMESSEKDPYYNVDRLWLAQHLLTPSLTQDIRQKEYPLFLKPDEKLTVSKAAEVLRAGYHGTPLEDKATRPIGVVRTAQSHIMTLNTNMPEKLQCTIWQTLGTPLGSAYIPLYARICHIPQSYAMGGNDYDCCSAYWKFRSLFSLADRAGTKERDNLRQEWQTFESGLIDEYYVLQKLLSSIGNNTLAEHMAESFSTSALLRAEEFAETLRQKLLTEIAVEQNDC